MSTLDPRIILRQKIEGSTMRAVAEELGVSSAYLSDIMANKRDPGPKVLDPLGLEAVTIYRRKRKPQ